MFKECFITLIMLLFLTGCNSKPVVLEGKTLADKQLEEKIEFCNLKSNPQDVKDCKDTIVLEQAINMDDNNYCDYSSNDENRELCYSTYYLDKAEKEKRQAICGRVKDEELKKICLTLNEPEK